MKILLAAAALFAAVTAAHAAAGLQAIAPWSRPAVAGTNAAGYLTLVNAGSAPDALVKAESPLARTVEVHRSSMAGGMMSMRPEPRTALAPGSRTAFAPGGRHLMFVGLTRTLKPGDRIPAVLSFQSGARLQVAFVVSDGGPPPMSDRAPPGHMPSSH